MQVYKLRLLSVFPHISYAQLGGVAFTASIFVCITRSNLNLTTGTNALYVYIAHSYHWFDVFFHMIIIKDHPRKPHPRAASRLTPPRRRGEWIARAIGALSFDFWILIFELSAFSRCWVFEFWFSLLKAPAFFTFLLFYLFTFKRAIGFFTFRFSLFSFPFSRRQPFLPFLPFYLFTFLPLKVFYL